MSTIIEINKSWLFSKIILNVSVVDRRPDMRANQSLTKYVTKVYFKYFSKTWSIEMYSKSISHVYWSDDLTETSITDEQHFSNQ